MEFYNYIFTLIICWLIFSLQTFTVHQSPVTRVMLSEKHLVSVCSEYNHVRTWSVTRFRGMISTQPGSTPLASFKIITLEDMDPCISYHAGTFQLDGFKLVKGSILFSLKGMYLLKSHMKTNWGRVRWQFLKVLISWIHGNQILCRLHLVCIFLSVMTHDTM